MVSKSFWNKGRDDMFRLRILKSGLFQIHKLNGRAFEGDPRSILDKAVKMGVQKEDLTYAIDELQKYHHDYADFSVSGRLLWTKKN